MELHTLHIAGYQAANGERTIRPTLLKSLGQCCHKGHQVCLAKRGIHTQAHLARIYRVSEREGQIKFNVKLRIGCLQVEFGQLQTAILHHDGSCQVSHLQAALLSKCQCAHVEAHGRVVIVDGVDAHVDISQTDVVEVKSFCCCLYAFQTLFQCRQVILYGTVQPVNTAYGISLCSQVDDGLLDGQCAEVGSYGHRIARHAEHQVCLFDFQLVGMNHPRHFRLCRILGD